MLTDRQKAVSELMREIFAGGDVYGYVSPVDNELVYRVTYRLDGWMVDSAMDERALVERLFKLSPRRNAIRAVKALDHRERSYKAQWAVRRSTRKRFTVTSP